MGLLNKKGQTGVPSASSAAIFVLLITLAIVLYVLFLPPEYRQELLDGTSLDDNITGYSDLNSGSGIVLKENVGVVEYIKNGEIIHSLPSFSISAFDKNLIIKKMDSAHIKNSVFEKKAYNFTLDVDKDRMKDFYLSFDVKLSDGPLIIYVNGQLISEKLYHKGSINPIKIPDDMLVSGKNTVLFFIERPSWAFWRVDEYFIQNILISGIVKDKSNSKVDQDFTLSSTEYGYMEKATLSLYTSCVYDNLETMSIRLNNRVVYSGKPLCNNDNYFDISLSDLRSGLNNLEFETNSGRYVISQVKITTIAKDIIYPTYFFDLPESLFYVDNYDNDVFDPSKALVLSLDFSNSDRKKGIILLNGYEIQFDTSDINYEKDVSLFARFGSNSVEIRPKDDLTINEMKFEVFYR